MAPDAPPDAPAGKPDLEEVAALLWARTVDDEQETDGEFTEDTQPTAAQAQMLLDQAFEDVRAICVAGEIPERSVEAAKRATALRAAYLIELSFFPEQTADMTDSPYLQLRYQAETALQSFILVSQLRDMFGVGNASN